MKWLARAAHPSGILSTRAPILRAAADESLLTVLRIFMVDSSSLATGVRMAKSCEPTLIEVMPGLVTRALRRLSDSVGQPVIAGGMLEAAEDVAQDAAGILPEKEDPISFLMRMLNKIGLGEE